MRPGATTLLTRTIAIGVVVLGLSAGSVGTGEAVLEEGQVKAAFLFNFAKFVVWPETTDGPMVLCVVGDDPLADLLQTTVRGRVLKGRPFAVLARRHADDPTGCHLLYIAPTRQLEDSDLLKRVRGPILTVGETVRFLRDGGAIRLFLENNRLQFQINREAATAAGLEIRSQLLSLAAK